MTQILGFKNRKAVLYGLQLLPDFANIHYLSKQKKTKIMSRWIKIYHVYLTRNLKRSINAGESVRYIVLMGRL